jgi:hypothetical protein
MLLLSPKMTTLTQGTNLATHHAKLNSVVTYTTVGTVIFELPSLSLRSSTHFNKSGNHHKTETNPLTYLTFM